jgi:tetratricopeptide (TPR) repeat protein
VNEQAAELARSNGDDRAQLLADSSRMHVLVKLGRMEEALGLTQRILHRTEDLEDPHLVALTHRDLAFNLAAQGAFAIARTHIERACTIARQAKVPQELIIATAIRGWLAFLRGDWRGARLDLEQAVTLSRGGDRSR